MRIEITDRDFALLSKRKAALDQAAQQYKLSELALKASEQQCISADQALKDVMDHVANLKEPIQFVQFSFGKDDQGYFLNFFEPEKPASPQADPPADPLVDHNTYSQAA